LSCYWAKFEMRNNHLFRFDTRVYLKSIVEPSNEDLCVGAVVGKNPGSAFPYGNKSSIQEVDLNKDQLLPNIKSIFGKAYRRANKPIPDNSYVQVLNLIYVCDINPAEAIKKLEIHPNVIICDTERNTFPFIWYVWGGDNRRLNFYKPRIHKIKSDRQFYFNTNTHKVINAPPRINDAARHTQGLQHDLIVPFISTIL
jgi:hypothetical protein